MEISKPNKRAGLLTEIMLVTIHDADKLCEAQPMTPLVELTFSDILRRLYGASVDKILETPWITEFGHLPSVIHGLRSAKLSSHAAY